MGKVKKWTKEEDSILINFYSRYGSKYCSELLDRGASSIIRRSKFIGLKFGKTRFKYLRENLEPVVKSSKTISEILDKLELRKAGGNFQIIKNYIEKYQFDISHFENDSSDRFFRMVDSFVRKPLDLYLIENSTYSRSSLKKRLYKEGILSPICSLCGQDENWNGTKISLILDHINGVHNDNRIENLRIVCPNCNAGLDTFAGKNNDRKLHVYECVKPILGQSKKKKLKIRVDICLCGGEKNVNSKLCIKCYTINRRVVERPPIEELISDIQSIGYSATGRKYGVSDNAIRKWIKIIEE